MWVTSGLFCGSMGQMGQQVRPTFNPGPKLMYMPTCVPSYLQALLLMHFQFNQSYNCNCPTLMTYITYLVSYRSMLLPVNQCKPVIVHCLPLLRTYISLPLIIQTQQNHTAIAKYVATQLPSKIASYVAASKLDYQEIFGVSTFHLFHCTLSY